MLYIRADANNIIGTGHLMRCLSIADAARRFGEETTFILADNAPEELIKKSGYPYYILGSVWNDMETELPAITEYLRKNKAERLIVDSYFVTKRYLNELRGVSRVMYIDDLNAFHYPVDILVCYASYYEKFRYHECYGDTELLLGTSYAPLRSEFSDCEPKHISEKIEKLLITSGGTDNFGFVETLLDALDKDKYRQITAICGIYHNSFERLSEKYRGFPSVKLLKNTDRIKYFMEEADAAVSAGGTTLYELAAVGTPTISYILADNQIDNARWWAERNIISCAGDLRTDDAALNVIRLLDTDYADTEQRKARSLKMQKTVDGLGAERIINRLLCFGGKYDKTGIQ